MTVVLGSHCVVVVTQKILLSHELFNEDLNKKLLGRCRKKEWYFSTLQIISEEYFHFFKVKKVVPYENRRLKNKVVNYPKLQHYLLSIVTPSLLRFRLEN